MDLRLRVLLGLVGLFLFGTLLLCRRTPQNATTVASLESSPTSPFDLLRSLSPLCSSKFFVGNKLFFLFYADRFTGKRSEHRERFASGEEYAYLRKAVVAFLSRLGPNPRCVDVGTNIGYVSHVMGVMGCTVTGFEANPVTAKFAQLSVRLNKLEGSITILNKAISRKSGSVQLAQVQTDAESWANSLYDHIDVSERKNEQKTDRAKTYISIPSTGLGEVLPLEPHAFVKIDCEGCEAMAIETLQGQAILFFFFFFDFFLSFFFLVSPAC